jgi:hypothetical protein
MPGNGNQGASVRRGRNAESTLADQPPRGILAGFLTDRDMVDVLTFYPYEIHNQTGKVLEGETDENGYFRHDDLVADYYVLKANGVEYTLPTLSEEDRPYQIRVLGELGVEEEEEIRDITQDPEYVDEFSEDT